MAPARRRSTVAIRVLLALLLSVAPALSSAQTAIKPPKNKYTPEQDVQIGREAAEEVRKAMPLIHNDAISTYLTRLGEQLVAAAPTDLNNPAYQYSFTPVNAKDINAFALPGGPMFVNRGMIEAASREDEVVGVMAHELSHVLLRHGTANMTKAQNPGIQLGAIAGAVAGAVVGGGAGSMIASASQFGLGTLLLRYSREFEKQADLLGVQIMARAGYDPRALATVFETIQKQGGGTPPQWLSSHPNPGNRTEYILKESAALQVAPRPADESGFDHVRSMFASMAPPPKSGGARTANTETPDMGTLGEPVPPPSTGFRTLRAGNFLEVSVPGNWQPISSNNSLKVVPKNGFGQQNGQAVFTHGVEFGTARGTSRNLQQATDALLQGLAQGNPDLRMTGEQEITRLSGRTAIATSLSNRSVLGEGELIGLYTTFLSDGNVFYYLTVVPAADSAAYRSTFSRIGNSIRLSER